jgi:hypothetical protein
MGRLPCVCNVHALPSLPTQLPHGHARPSSYQRCHGRRADRWVHARMLAAHSVRVCMAPAAAPAAACPTCTRPHPCTRCRSPPPWSRAPKQPTLPRLVCRSMGSRMHDRALHAATWAKAHGPSWQRACTTWVHPRPPPHGHAHPSSQRYQGALIDGCTRIRDVPRTPTCRRMGLAHAPSSRASVCNVPALPPLPTQLHIPWTRPPKRLPALPRCAGGLTCACPACPLPP